MENFITGFPGHESSTELQCAKFLDPEIRVLLQQMAEYFFTDADAKFFAEVGLNCLRLPFNYRHFEDDINPRVLKESGFKHLDRVVDLVSSAFMMSLSWNEEVLIFRVIVCCPRDIHYLGHACCSWWTESRLAL